MYQVGDHVFAYDAEIHPCGLLGELVRIDGFYCVVRLLWAVKGHTVIRCNINALKPSRDVQKRWDEAKEKPKLPKPSANISKLSEEICKALTKTAR